MKTFRILLVIPVILFSYISYSQTYDSENLDGVVFFKLKDNVPIESDEFIRNLPFRSETENFVSFDDYPEIKNALSAYSVTKLERPSYYSKKPQLMRIFRVYFTNYSEVDNIIKDLAKLSLIEYAEKSPIRKIGFTPNDALYSQTTNKWYFTLVSAESAWNNSLGSNNIKVAIVDNAVFCGHSDLTTFKQRDVADSDNDATPPLDANADFTWSHGTHCAGLATADINNSLGMASLGGNVELIGIKCTPDNGTSNSVYYGYTGIQWACQNGANVVSMSWGGGGFNSSEQLLFNNYPGIVFFGAAGNDGSTTPMYPGAYTNVICVGSVDATDLRSSFSNYNGTTTWVDIASPGGYSNGGLLNTVYTAGGNNYAKMGGTSMATPFAAGLAGLMLSINSSLSSAEIKNCMVSTGATINQNIGPRINANAAVQCVIATMTGDPNANFIANNNTIAAGNSVNFTDLSNDGGNAITSWQWSFPGGSTTSYNGQVPPAITYNTIGTYNVSLTVTNSQSSDTETKTAYINVVVQPYGAWIGQASGFSAQYRGINYISIVNPSVIWATAYDGSGSAANIQEFTKTTNGGTTWTPGTINLGNTGLGVSMIHAYDATTAWLAAYPNASGQIGGVWKTTNGGTTWTRQTTATFNNAASFTNVVYFWDANNGFCQGDPINSEFELYTTTNGGTTWTLVPGANIPAPLTGEYGYTRQIEVVGNIVWFTTNKGRIYKSTDKGVNWVVYQSPLTDFGGASMNGNLSFKDSNNGLIVNNSGLVYKSTNGGSTWTQVTTTGPVNTIGLCWIEGTDYVFTTGAGGSSFSQDGGTTWNPIDTDQHTAVEFISPSTGWSGWFNTSSTADGIWKWQNTSTLEANFTGVPTIICAGSSVNFTDQTTGGTPTSWAWSFTGGTPATSSLQNPTITYNSPGTYTVALTVDDGNGPATKTISNYITVNSAPAQPSVINGITNPCPGSVTTYSVAFVFGVTYTWNLPSGWSGSSSLNTIDVTVGTTGGTITVTPSNSCGQGTARTLAVTTNVEPGGSFTFTQNQNEVTFTNTSNPNGTDFFWTFGDGQWSQDENPTHIYDQIGDYEVTFFVSTSCGTDTLYDTVHVTVLGLQEMTLNTLNMYPVPASDYLFVEWDKIQGETEYHVADVLGRCVLSEARTTLENRLVISVNTLNPGVYTLHVNTANETAIRKFVVR